MKAILNVDYQIESRIAIGQIGNVGNTEQLLILDEILNALDNSFWSDVHRQFGDNDPATPWRDLLYSGASSDPERAAAKLVRFANPAEANDDPTAWQIGPGDELHYLV